MQRRDALKTLGLAGSWGWGRRARASDYPAGPITLIVPFSAGGSTDIVARLVAPALARVLGQPIEVRNIEGAGGTRGAAQAARAAPDGLTLSVATVSTTGTGPLVRRAIDYDPIADQVPIIKLVDVPGVVTVHPDFPAQSLQGFLRAVRAAPGRYLYGSSGNGGVQHMGMELLKLRTQIYLVHIPYTGAGPALQDVLAGNVQAMWDNLSSSLPHIKAGRLRALGLVNAARAPQLPRLKTVTELGVANYDAATYFGLLAPGGTPEGVVNTVNQAANLVLREPAVREALIAAGAIPAGGPPAVLQRQIAQELAKWSEVVKYAKVVV